MLKLMKRLHRKEKGFTLVELMVVVVIIGILVAIAIPIYNAVQARAQENACHANLRTIDGQKTIAQMQEGTAEAGTWPDDYFTDGFPECPTGDNYLNTALDDEDPAECEEHGNY